MKFNILHIHLHAAKMRKIHENTAFFRQRDNNLHHNSGISRIIPYKNFLSTLTHIILFIPSPLCIQRIKLDTLTFVKAFSSPQITTCTFFSEQTSKSLFNIIKINLKIWPHFDVKVYFSM